MEPASLAPSLALLLQVGGVIALMAGGLLLTLQAKRMAGKALLLGVVMIVAGATMPQLAQLLGGVGALEIMPLLSAVVGVWCLFSGKGKLGLALLWPAVARWGIWPMAAPYLSGVPIGLLALIVLPFGAFILIWLLQRVLTPIYGREAASHVAGEYLLRTIDGLLVLVTLPFRLLARLLGR